MSKKKKTSVNLLVSPQKAADFLTKGKYKEAADVYKKLLKEGNQQEWRDGLAKAYLLRAKSLAAKGMFKEAIVIWENRASLSNDKELFEQYIQWLIEAEYYSRAIDLIVGSGTELSKTSLQQLMAKFGILLFEGHTDIINSLPQDLANHYAIIEQGLTSYCQGNKQLCEEHINQIPYRSHYRDFCLLIKALLIIDSNQNSAKEFLLKIPDNSPYSNFAKLIQLVFEPYSVELLEKLTKLSQSEQDFISCLKGWDKQQFKAISVLKKVTDNITFEGVLKFLISNRQIFGEKYVQQSCISILSHYKDGIELYENNFTTLSEFEKNRIVALYCEQRERLFAAKKHWQICIDILKQNRKQNSLKIALILRHQVEILKEYKEFFDKTYVSDFLIESIDFAPNYKESYLDLTSWYKENKRDKKYYNWAETAVKQFPQDSDILFVAMEAATARKSFKKALKYAVTLLKIDPINVKARNIARASHIAHAQKLLKAGKYTLARKELNEAEQLEKASRQTGIIQINQGLLDLQEQGFIKPNKGQLALKLRTKPLKPLSSKNLKAITEKYPQAVKLLRKGVELAGGGILGQFQLIIICKKQNLDATEIYPLVVDSFKFSFFGNKPEQNKVLELVNLINTYAEEGVNFLYDAVEQMKEKLQDVIKVKLAKEDMISFCQCIKRVEHYELLAKIATHGLKHWKQQPALIFYQIYGIVKGNVWYLSDAQFDKLHQAASNAKEQGDNRTAIMIGKFVEEMYGGDIFPHNPIANLTEDDKEQLEIIATNIEDLKEKGGLNPEKKQEIFEKIKNLGIINIPDEMPHD